MASEAASSMIISNNTPSLLQLANLQQPEQPPPAKIEAAKTVNKKKRSLPGTPDPDAEVIALSPRTLLATNRFVCEICGKGFQRDQNLQLHRRGHNLPWKLRQRSGKEPRKRVYVCPEKSCVHHNPARALGDLTGIKKHFCRKHGEKKWKCDKCSKKYAVQSDWKAHAKTCGTREYRCDCGTLFSRRDSFITHRAFCDALAEETARLNAASTTTSLCGQQISSYLFAGSPPGIMRRPNMMPGGGGAGVLPVPPPLYADLFSGAVPSQLEGWLYGNGNKLSSSNAAELTATDMSVFCGQQQHAKPAAATDMSATALLQKAAQMGAVTSGNNCSVVMYAAAGQTHADVCNNNNLITAANVVVGREETRDFLGVGVQPLGSASLLHGWI